MVDRRDFLTAGLAGAVALGLSGTAIGKIAKAVKPMKILVLGGTGFLGPHFVTAARARGHTLTLFNRGKTHPGLFKGVDGIEILHGDRKDDLTALTGRRWDAVLDTSAYIPADVTRSANLLGKSIAQYVLISTLSAYAKLDRPGMDETAPLAVLADPTVDQVTNETYGGLKALCERAAQTAMPGRVTIIRPDLIVGPGDPTDRFTYWPVRFARGGEVLAPESPQAPTQFIDARDLAGFLLHLIEQRTFGIFNADAQAGTITIGRLLAACQAEARTKGVASTITWLPVDFLEQQHVGAWTDLPSWIPAKGDDAGYGRVSAAKAKAAGLTTRPVADTVRDTLAWWQTLPPERRAKPNAGLSPEREAAVLAVWHSAHPGGTG